MFTALSGTLKDVAMMAIDILDEGSGLEECVDRSCPILCKSLY